MVAFGGWMKMNDKVFNTEFEISMRLLLVLSLSNNNKFTIDKLVTADFISNYSKEFGLSNSNLHGDNEFSFSEFSARRSLSQQAIKQLVLENLVRVSYSNDGFIYSITEWRGYTKLDSFPMGGTIKKRRPHHGKKKPSPIYT